MTKQKEFKFKPRIINPKKIRKTIIFSAEEQVRTSSKTLRKNMPWIKIRLMNDPLSASNYESKRAIVFIFDDTALTLVDTDKIRRHNQDAVIILFSSLDFIQSSPPETAQQKYPYTSKADLVFAVSKGEFSADNIISAAVRAAEDLINIKKYSKAKRYIVLIVDDEPRWFSQFLPVLYNIIGQRADVEITRTYEETLQFLFGVDKESKINPEKYHSAGKGDDIICLITDITFPKSHQLDDHAGKKLIDLTRKYHPRIPIIVASKAKTAAGLKDTAFTLPKGDPGSLNTLAKYIHDFTGMGDFLVYNKTGEELFRISNIHDLYAVILEAEKETKKAKQLRILLEEYGRKDAFSTWLYMHSFRELGDILRPIHIEGLDMIALLKKHFKKEIHRTKYTPLNIEGNKINDLSSLLKLLRTIEPEKIQKFTDTDIFSSWLDRKGYTGLAEDIRPIHGEGAGFVKTLADHVENWIEIYRTKNKI